jgi:hypothetical protein
MALDRRESKGGAMKLKIGSMLGVVLACSLVASAQQAKHVVTLTPADYEEIRNVHASLGHMLDFRDVEGFVNIFTSDGQIVEIWGSVEKVDSKGSAEIRSLAAGMAKDKAGAPREGATAHFYTNPMITATAEGANVKAYYVGIGSQPGPDGAQVTRFSGKARYDDDLVKTPQGWKFKVHRVRWDPPYPANVVKPSSK